MNVSNMDMKNMRELMFNVEDCRTCKHYKKLIKYTYVDNGGCEHSIENGFACLCFCGENIVIHMINSGYYPCEMYTIKYGVN